MALIKSKTNAEPGSARSRRTIVLVAVLVVLLLLGAGGYAVWQAYKPRPAPPAPQARQPADAQYKTYLQESSEYVLPKGADATAKANYLRFQAANAAELKNYATAASRYEELLVLPGFASDFDALYGLGDAYARLGEADKAKMAFERLLDAYRSRGINDKDLFAQIQKRIDSL